MVLEKETANINVEVKTGSQAVSEIVKVYEQMQIMVLSQMN